MKLVSYAFLNDPFKATDKSLTLAQPPVAGGGLQRALETLERPTTTATTWRREAAGTGASGAPGHTCMLLIKLNWLDAVARGV